MAFEGAADCLAIAVPPTTRLITHRTHVLEVASTLSWQYASPGGLPSAGNCAWIACNCVLDAVQHGWPDSYGREYRQSYSSVRDCRCLPDAFTMQCIAEQLTVLWFNTSSVPVLDKPMHTQPVLEFSTHTIDLCLLFDWFCTSTSGCTLTVWPE